MSVCYYELIDNSIMSALSSFFSIDQSLPRLVLTYSKATNSRMSCFSSGFVNATDSLLNLSLTDHYFG